MFIIQSFYKKCHWSLLSLARPANAKLLLCGSPCAGHRYEQWDAHDGGLAAGGQVTAVGPEHVAAVPAGESPEMYRGVPVAELIS